MPLSGLLNIKILYYAPKMPSMHTYSLHVTWAPKSHNWPKLLCGYPPPLLVSVYSKDHSYNGLLSLPHLESDRLANQPSTQKSPSPCLPTVTPPTSLLTASINLSSTLQDGFMISPEYPLISPPFNAQKCSSVQFSHSVVSDSLQPHGLQYARLPCPLPTPGADSNSCPLSQ